MPETRGLSAQIALQGPLAAIRCPSTGHPDLRIGPRRVGHELAGASAQSPLGTDPAADAFASPEKNGIMAAMESDPGPAGAEGGLILGIDPGLRRTGYALLAGATGGTGGRLREAGLISLDANAPVASRLLELEQGLARLIATHEPACLACEELYAHYKHPRTAILMAHARGVVLCAAARAGLEIISVGATHMKKHLTGSGRAGKPQVQRAVAMMLGLPRLPEPHDVADAIALALCGLQMRRADVLSAGKGRP